MNQQTYSLIKEIENKITETKLLISTYKQEISNYENTLKSLIKELNQIKKDMKNNNNQTIADNSEINL